MMLFFLSATAVVLSLISIVGALQFHSIWPCDVIDNVTNSRITEDLRRNFESSQLFISQNVEGGILFWNAPLNDGQKGYYSSLRGVSRDLLGTSM